MVFDNTIIFLCPEDLATGTGLKEALTTFLKVDELVVLASDV
jgi:hypothetical protein